MLFVVFNTSTNSCMKKLKLKYKMISLKKIDTYFKEVIIGNGADVLCLHTVCDVCMICVFVFQVCETYPRDLYVPITASKPIIVGSSKFRSKGRFPVLTYFYQEKKVMHCNNLHTVLYDLKNNNILLCCKK